MKMIQVLEFSCGHSEMFERDYRDRVASAGDAYKCPRCGLVVEVTETKARSK